MVTTKRIDSLRRTLDRKRTHTHPPIVAVFSVWCEKYIEKNLNRKENLPKQRPNETNEANGRECVRGILLASRVSSFIHSCVRFSSLSLARVLFKYFYSLLQCVRPLVARVPPSNANRPIRMAHSLLDAHVRFVHTLRRTNTAERQALRSARTHLC